MAERGRPTVYTKEIFDEICDSVGEGISLRKTLLQDRMPKARTFYRWIREHPELCQQYARAKEDRADTYVDDIINIADELDGKSTLLTSEKIQAAKLRIDARKWIACKLHPRNYGDKKEEDKQEMPQVTVNLNK